MALIIRPADERGFADHGWLKARHSFSFANYYDPEHMGVSALRVINEDRVAPGQGFPMHPHRDMEIITVILAGQIEHKDSMGNTRRLHAGDIQVMSAGTGVVHSEYNPSNSEELHLLQIWIEPNQTGIKPSHAERKITGSKAIERLVSADGSGQALPIHQDAEIYRVTLSGQPLSLPLPSGRWGYVQVISGALQLDDITLTAGDGVTITPDHQPLDVRGEAAQLLLFNLPLS